MKGKLVTVFILFLMVISACGKAAAPTETPAPPTAETMVVPITGATETAPATVTESPVTSTSLPESTPTSAPPRPTNFPDCTNNASFITDVTIPDNSDL